MLTVLTVSCSDDDDNTVTFANTPEVDAAGVYSGTFASVQDGVANADTSFAEGTMTISAKEAYVANVAYSCEELKIGHESTANIAHSNGGFAFSNNDSSNGLGEAFIGRVDENGNAESHLTLKIRNGRNTKKYNIVFTGKRVQQE